MWQVLMMNNDREKDTIEIESTNNHQAMLDGEEEYSRPGWHAESARRIDNEQHDKKRT